MPEYRDVPGFPGYRVGDDGTIWSCWNRDGSYAYAITGKWRLLEGSVIKDGYIRVGLSRDQKLYGRLIHHLVLEAFVGQCPPGMVCRHFPDRDPSNNRLENLQWGTQLENQRDRLVHKTDNRGTNNGRAKLNEDKVLEIRKRHQQGENTLDLAHYFGVSRNTIYRVIHKENWSYHASISPETE